ncbi:hypothetical protein AXG93_2016s1150 [Marchantia polymorpha subsp. ruderalis]|uniref:Uncharacterized protein n=1 Tax=Marchantia polymorpha subsp. ruderalis TaxID=1480154 RepID=A0A176VV77_MARPO|nr:hypothetical protein AXG93_2016s1150 [Marchantia polymorpha subsp. ruderalis]
MRPATKHQNLASSIRRRRRRRHNPGGRGRRRSGTIPHRRTGRAVKRSHVALSPRGDVPAIPRPVPFGPYLTALGLAADTGPGPNRAQSIAFYRFKSNRRWGWLGSAAHAEPPATSRTRIQRFLGSADVFVWHRCERAREKVI